MFLIVGTVGPMYTLCAVPLCSDPFVFLPFGVRISIVYSAWPILLGLLLDVPFKLPSYLGFFASKAIS